MAFHDVRFPARLSFGSVGGPERRTEIVTLTSGHEERSSPWAHSRRRYDAGVGLRSLDDVEGLLAFFEARHGRLHGFRWKDWADFKSCAPSADPAAGDQVIGVGDGVMRSFALSKGYVSGGVRYARPISKPVSGTVRMAVDDVELVQGAGFEVDIDTGLCTLPAPPHSGAQVTAGFEFDVPVRFDTDLIQVSVASFRAGEVPNVPVIEVRL
ncbi:glycoside hydrolase family 24 [Brevirhabdus pacifica]|uniref:Glycoside hydrolase family 24 n=1 Tax=Brevirhabdus pacifica TaxID=1267768 RepID=A0A1U7DEE0_9RHOB|nr:DUF2460 domain-containing protein [Brevirhabdus pacifica]APX88380.1 glycoside hydrolase family 24 [Brevirhabdus pacifica]OWU79697.1 glycoside hydrolase family 24 [Loktanella sp. 22II-4b]PJJ87165.1 uncharacterized protein (TIGR02217 family) [Brevirhabdus pacifica]